MKSLQTEKGMQYSYEKLHTVQANSGSWDKSSRVYHPVAPYLRLWPGKSCVCGLCRYKDHNETAGCIEGRYRVCYDHCHINNGNVGI